MSFEKYMDIFLEGYDSSEHKDILETARVISSDDKAGIEQIKLAINDPRKYFKDNMDRFKARGIDLENDESGNKLDADELLWLAMVDELEEHGYVFEFDWKCELKDFLWGLEQIKNYPLIADAMKTVKLDENKDIEAWSKELSTAVGDKVFICYLNFDSDSYAITVVTAETFEKIPAPMVISGRIEYERI